MQVKVISDTIQEFMGQRYYLCGHYFQREGVRLHRVVWEAANGTAVPDGWHVHHKDHDKTNNAPSNLEILSGSEHASHHSTGARDDMPEAAREAARQWHGSEAGRKWHREHFEQNCREKLHRRDSFTCEQCGKSFITQVTGRNRFCSNGCKSASRRASGVDDENRVCTECGGGFRANKYTRKLTCSPKCAAALSARRRRRRE